MIEAHSFQQSELFNGALALLGRPPQRLAMPTGSVFALRRFGLSLATRPHDAPETYAELAKKRIRIINAESAHPALRQNGYRQLIKPAHIASLPLSPDPVIQRAAMQPKWRRSLERFEAERPKHITLTHRAFDPDRDAWLLEAEAAQARTRRFRCYPSALTCALSTASPKSLRLFSLNGPEAPRAAMLFACTVPAPPIISATRAPTRARSARIGCSCRKPFRSCPHTAYQRWNWASLIQIAAQTSPASSLAQAQ